MGVGSGAEKPPLTPGCARQLDMKERARLEQMVVEFLHFHSYAESARMLKREVAEAHRRSKSASTASAALGMSRGRIHGRLMREFESGGGDEFFKLWERYILSQPEHHRGPSAAALEFYLHVHFAIFHLRRAPEGGRDRGGGGGEDVEEDADTLRLRQEQGMRRYKAFLDSRGGRELSQAQEFLPFYALPYVADPRRHPTFRPQFSRQWMHNLHARLDAFLVQVLDRVSEPDLHAAYRAGLGGGGGGGGGARGRAVPRLASEGERQAQATAQELFKCTAELFDAVHRGTITAPFMAAVRNRLARCNAVLFHGGEGAPQALQPHPPVQQQQQQQQQMHMQMQQPHINHHQHQHEHQQPPTATQPEQRRPRQLRLQHVPRGQAVTFLAPLDYSRVAAALARPPSTPEDSVGKAALLQALRWRLGKARRSGQRRAALGEYVAHDVLGLRAAATDTLGVLLGEHATVAESALRLLNCAASYSAGRTYLLGGTRVVERLFGQLAAETGESARRQHALGALQKLSLRRAAQDDMIGLGVMEHVAGVLLEAGSQGGVSEYTVEYASALLMNLCLRRSGKDRVERMQHAAEDSGEHVDVLQALGALMEHENCMIRTYCNGTLYSVLARASMRTLARSVGLREALEHTIESGGGGDGGGGGDDDDSDAAQIRQQVGFIAKQLAAEHVEEAPSEEDDDPEEPEEDFAGSFDAEDAAAAAVGGGGGGGTAADEEDEEDELRDVPGRSGHQGEELLIRMFRTGPEPGTPAGARAAAASAASSPHHPQTHLDHARDVPSPFRPRPAVPRTPAVLG